MKRCLLVLRTLRTAGAERVCFGILEKAKLSFDVSLASLSRKDGSQTGVHGLREILFGKYDLIHSHLFLPGLLIRFRRLYDSNFVWVHTVHYCGYEGQWGARVKKFFDLKWVFSKPDRLVAVSSQVEGFLKKFPNRKLIQNGLDLVEIKTPGRPIDSMVFTLGTLGMLRAEKGLRELIAVMPSLVRVFPQIRLVIGGDGPLRAELEQQILRLKLENHVKLLGYLKDPKEFFESIDMYISHGFTESFGMSLYEAMQFSLPIIATQVGAVEECLKDGEFGILLPDPYRRKESLAGEILAAIRQITAEPLEWQSRSHRGLVFHQSRLSVEKTKENYVSLYRHLLKPGICMLCPVVTHAMGGLQKQLKLQAQELMKQGYRIFILQRRDPLLAEKNSDWPDVDFLSTPNPLAKKLPQAPGLKSIRAGFFFVFGILLIYRKRKSIQVIHAHQLYSPTLVGAVCKVLFHKRLIVKVTASGLLGELREVRRLPFYRLRKWAFKKIDKLIVLSNEMQNEMKQLGFSENKIALIPNSVKIPKSPRYESQNQFYLTSAFRILYCGRLSTEKSLDTLLRAAHELIERGIPCEVHLVGGTYGGRDTTAELKALAAELPGLPVTFHGIQKDVAPFYLTSDVFVLPSASEGMSNALLEAMSYGLPCIASDIVPNKALIEDNVNGLLFKQGDVTDLAKKLIQVARDQQGAGPLSFHLGFEARNSVQSNFSTELICKQLNHLYQDNLKSEALVYGVH